MLRETLFCLIHCNICFFRLRETMFRFFCMHPWGQVYWSCSHISFSMTSSLPDKRYEWPEGLPVHPHLFIGHLPPETSSPTLSNPIQPSHPTCWTGHLPVSRSSAQDVRRKKPPLPIQVNDRRGTGGAARITPINGAKFEAQQKMRAYGIVHEHLVGKLKPSLITII